MTTLRVAVPPCDPAAVYDHRNRWAAEHLASEKLIELVVADPPEIRVANRRYGKPQPVGVVNIPDVDVMVLTRILAGSLAEAIPLIQAKGVAVVIDIDDDYRHLPPGMEARQKIQSPSNPYYNWRWAARACKDADLVSCSTEALRAWAPHGRAAVLRNLVPKRYLTIQAPKDGKTVGWSGAVSMHPGDLQSTRGGVGRALAEVDGDFMVVGDRTSIRKVLELHKDPSATGVVDHMSFPYRVAEFDVGIAPLADNRFNCSKSWLKILQYVALGVPFVCSPTHEYRLLTERLPAGFYGLAKPKSREWYREVIRLLKCPQDVRAEIGEQLRLCAGKNWLYENNADRWLHAWQRAAEHRAKGKRVAEPQPIRDSPMVKETRPTRNEGKR
jgi:hypothetical protein